MLDIVRSELRPLQEESRITKDEEAILTKIRNKKLTFLVTTYLTLTVTLIYAGIYGVMRSYRFGPDEVERAQKLAPYLITFFFLLLTIYFYNFFRKSILPLMRDIKKGIKQNQFFIPGKYIPPLVAEFYLKTPLTKIPLIKVDKDFYDSIHINSTACISFMPCSKFVLSVQVDNKKVNFNYSVKMNDL